MAWPLEIGSFGNEMCHLAEPVNHCENDRVPTRRGKTSDVQGDVGPWTLRHRKGMQKPSRGSMRRLVLATDRTGIDVLASVLFQRGPPEALLQYITSPPDSRMRGKFAGVSPLEHVRPQS